MPPARRSVGNRKGKTKSINLRKMLACRIPTAFFLFLNNVFIERYEEKIQSLPSLCSSSIKGTNGDELRWPLPRRPTLQNVTDTPERENRGTYKFTSWALCSHRCRLERLIIGDGR